MRTSAGLLPFRERDGVVEVLLGHMGGPMWARRDDHAWTLVKGEFDPATEAALDAARREFVEETGLPVPAGELLELGDVTQSGGKRVTAWAVRAEIDPETHRPGTFEMEWPPRSGRIVAFPELDRLAWWDLPTARAKVVAAQAAFLDRLSEAVTGSTGGAGGRGTII